MSKGIFLTGMPGSGKSTIGKALSEFTHIPFYDLDEEIEKYAGSSIQQIWEGCGEYKFREIEQHVLKSILDRSNEIHTIYICALGGGTWMQEMNRTIVKTAGLSVFLDASVQILHKRLSKSDLRRRPVLVDSSESDLKKILETLISRRISTYMLAEKRVHIVDNIKKDLKILKQVLDL